MSKHTPIPWAVSDRPSCHGCEVAVGSPNGPVILFPSSASWLSLDERRANAEIIVRAVNAHAEMLEACKRVNEIITQMALDGQLLTLDEFCEIQSRLSDAIRKAEDQS